MIFSRRNIYFMLFAMSGFSGLIYESIWTHYLKLFLGHAAYAQTLVIAIFMGGMALGSWVCSRYSSRWKNLLFGYAVTEGIIGLCALIFHHAFAYTIEISYSSIIPQLGNPAFVSVFKWTLSALMILPQSILLGMTFPLMSAGIIRLFPEKPGRSVAMLYFTNSIGAAIGVLVSGFVLIKLTGLPGTIRIAGLINVVLALTVWLLIRKTHIAHERFEVKQEQTPEQSSARRYRFFLLASLVTGASSFIYEIGWIRMLSLVLGSSTHAFELMLSAFIFGLAFGGLWIQRRIDQVLSPVRYLAHVQVIMGLLALSTLILYGHTFEVMQWLIQSLSKTDAGYTLFNLSSNAIALGIMLPATFCAGMTLPLLTLVLMRQGYGERSIGAVYAADTVGAILGVFFAIHIGMPLLGLKGLITFGASLDIVLGLALFCYAAPALKSYWKAVVITGISICAVAGTLLFVNLDPYQMASGVYRFGRMLIHDHDKVLYHKDGKTATVSLTVEGDGAITIRTNGKSDAAVEMNEGKEANLDEPTMILLAAIPMTFNSQARTAASIGMGSGLTSQTLLSNPFIKEVDTVEIESKMVEAAKSFRPRTELVYTDPRSKIYIDDAKTFFSTYNKKYDLIISEPSNPWVSGVAGLFSDEFYRLIRTHMDETSLFVQWVQLYEINVDLVVSVLKAIAANFSDFAVYASNDVDMLIIARKSGLLLDPDASVLKIPAIAAALKRIHVEGVQDVAIRRIGTKKSFGKFLKSFPIRANSDYYPVLDQDAERARFLGDTAEELIRCTHLPLPTLEMLTGSNLPQATNIDPSPLFPKSEAAFMAMALRDYIRDGKFDSKYGNIPAHMRHMAARLRQFFLDCGSNTNEVGRFQNYFDVSTNMIPYLSPSELDSFWKRFESGRCAANVSAQEKEWLALFEAVSNRDASRMAAAARTLLERTENYPSGLVRYLVATGMLGSLVQGDKAGSYQLWLKYKAKMFSDKEPDLLFRLLVAESTAN
jgi:predicted membrane-bound spermidine synthase